MLKLNNVTARWYKDRKIGGYDDARLVSFMAQQGEWVSVAGENGVGKSTLLHAIAGTANYVSGEILLDDVLLPPKRPALRFAAGIQMVSQHASLAGDLVIQDALDLAFLNRPGVNNQAAVKDLLRRLDALKIIKQDKLEPRVFELLVSLLSVPRVWILDEIMPSLPAAFRSVEGYQRLRELLPWTTVIFVDHDVERALSVADHVLWLKEDNAPVFFAKADATNAAELRDKLGSERAGGGELVGDDPLMRAIRLDRSPRSQVRLAFQAGHRADMILNEQDVYSDFPFLDSDRPSEMLSGGQRIVLLWTLLEVSRLGTLPRHLVDHLDRNIIGKVERRSKELQEKS